MMIKLATEYCMEHEEHTEVGRVEGKHNFPVTENKSIFLNVCYMEAKSYNNCHNIPDDF